MTILFSIIVNLIVFVLMLFIIALGLTWMLNPTANPHEIFQHWCKTYKGKYNEPI
jgi:thiaminase